MSRAGLKYYMNKRGGLFFFLSSRGLLNWMPDEAYLKRVFRYSVGYEPDLEHPKTFNEKLNWLKLHDRNPLYTQLVDKFEVRSYVAETIGGQYLIPLLGGPWESVDEIDFDALPDQFVLKCTHDSGGIVICRDKRSFDIPAAKEKLAERLKRDFSSVGREWPYRNVKPRIIAEQYLESSRHELPDYKYFVSGGQSWGMYIATGRGTPEGVCFDFYDMDFHHLPVTNGHPNAHTPPEKPLFFREMAELAVRLAAGIPQVRVDFFEVGDRIYFGEMTFFHMGGLTPFDPPAWDQTFGSWIHLPIDEEQP